ncbi:hypothetical protein ACIP6P_27505 [Streptomyces sp. NPDC088729]|uniref:hypothetical protein n=1 Tax=Streptomyces sp. NPDC088729 TaxID=3365876 RepID=UPI003802F376
MYSPHAPRDGLIANDVVGPDHFDEVDREQAVAAGVRLVNALRRFGVDLDEIGVGQVCHDCTAVKDAYRVELGSLRPEEVESMAAQLNAFGDEFQRMFDLLTPRSRGKPETRSGQGTR